jgi:hypothetical protein
MTEPVPATRADVLCSAWATLADVPEQYRDRVDEETWERLLMQASEIMWALSGRRWYGAGCEETATLRSNPPSAGRGTWPYDDTWGRCACAAFGAWTGSGWYPPPFGSHPGIDHPEPIAIRLPRNPIEAVVEVTENGVTVDPDAYRLTRSGWLERVDGGHWGVCGDVTEVTYTFGEPPPEGGVQAVITLAVQLMLDSIGDAKCRLPARVTNLTRQGISVSVMDPMDFLSNGRTGFYLVDLWLAAVNPLNRPARGYVWSPDIPTTIKGATTNVP